MVYHMPSSIRMKIHMLIKKNQSRGAEKSFCSILVINILNRIKVIPCNLNILIIENSKSLLLKQCKRLLDL